MSGIVSQNVGRPSGLVKAAAAGGGSWTLINTLTSDGSDDDLSFTSGIDSTYPIYVFKFINIHPETDEEKFQFQMSVDSGSNYNVTMTTTAFYAFHTEADDDTTFAYNTGQDIAQGTGFQTLAPTLGNAADESCSGQLWLFKPSSTTYVKHFLARTNLTHATEQAIGWHFGGYGNNTSAVDAIQFKMSSGQIQGGKIKMYGLGDS
tara:strand:- start:519 stop:1133 length:615 start_codon:yes stop_codon:yes gene_type:complete